MEDPLSPQLRAIAWADPFVRSALVGARVSGLASAWVVAGVIYGAVWNHLTGRPAGHGLNDVDIAYFDASDLSWDGEDAAMRRAAPAFAGLAAPVEIRNQARVHLWFPDRFGAPYPALCSVEEGVARYASRAHAVGLRLTSSGRLEVCAPFGLDEVFAMRVAPNRALPNRETHTRKSARIQRLWPEVAIVPW